MLTSRDLHLFVVVVVVVVVEYEERRKTFLDTEERVTFRAVGFEHDDISVYFI